MSSVTYRPRRHLVLTFVLSALIGGVVLAAFTDNEPVGFEAQPVLVADPACPGPDSPAAGAEQTPPALIPVPVFRPNPVRPAVYTLPVEEAVNEQTYWTI